MVDPHWVARSLDDTVTLVIAAACPRYAVQVSDRRLTTRSPRGALTTVSEEENKAIFWDLPTARLLVSYTGIARVGQIGMQEYLSERMMQAAKSAECEPSASVNALKDSLTKSLRHIPKVHRRLSVMLSGFVVSDDGSPMVCSCKLTNFQDWERGDDDALAWSAFSARFMSPKAGISWPTIMHHLGAWNAVDIEELEEIRLLLELDRPPAAVVGKILSYMPVWQKRAEGTIGPQLSSAVIHVENLNQPTWAYHAQSNSKTLYSGAIVKSRPAGSIVMTDIELTAGANAPPVVVPATPRRRPCPCGSGKQYRFCHGQHRPHRLPPAIRPDTRGSWDS